IGIADGGVTTDKLADDAVTNDKLANDAVTNDKLADNAVQTENIADGAVETSDIADKNVTATKLGADPSDAGKVGVVQADGSIVYQNISSESVDGADLSVSEGIAFTGGTDGTGKLLAAAGIGIADGGVTTDKLADDAVTNEKLADNAVQTENIADGAVTPGKMEAGNADQVMITNAAGNVEWIDRSEFNANMNKGNVTLVSGDGTESNPFVVDVSVNNGLSVADEHIQLGGNLVRETTITQNSNTLEIATGGSDLAVTGLPAGDAAADNIVAIDPSSGVLKQLKAAMPKFFYMPSVVFDVSASGTFTRNLHQEYLDQFTGTGLVGSQGAPSSIPNLPTATDLYYYITYYDNTVFSNIAIDQNGVLTYTVNSGATVTEGSFMNIVFVVK
ncbi:hypothetical protein, partial [Sinomicrobium oceani]|uniref:hypothetical protein n=1 Tax=Sinomicrobium oceani TaxID=1150368 RepID=UPI00227A75A9